MEPPQPGTAPSRRDTGGLGKLFPRAITSKQRRRKTQSSRTNSSLTESDGTGHADDDDRHSYYEDDGDALGVSGPADDSGSFGSFESGPEPSPSASRGSLSAVFKKASSRPGSSSASRDASR